MGDEERGRNGQDAGEQARGGYSILISEETMHAFMESGDFSSSRELDHFMEISAQVESRLREGSGHSIMALAMGTDRLSRDFAVLQIAHILAKRGRSTLIVDCDFLSPGLSGLVESVEEHGFLDLLLYGSSLKTVMKPTGIDGVSIVGPGSFPVSRTVPFAQKEFAKIRDFLARSCGVVIYCSTLYMEDGRINPLAGHADGILLTCRIEELPEGQLQKSLQEIPPGFPSADLVCFGAGKDEPAAMPAPVHAAAGPEGEQAPETEPAAIEKIEELVQEDEPPRGGVNLPRLVTVSVAVVVIVFLGWWFLIHRSISEKEDVRRSAELVQKQRDARGLSERRQVEAPAEESLEIGAEAGETAPAEEPAGVQADAAAVVREEPRPPAQVVDAERSPEEPAVTRTPAPAGQHFTVHVASFRETQRAAAERDYLEKRGFKVAVQETDVKGQAWFRVVVGEYGTREEAARARIELLALPRIGYAQIVTAKNR